MKKKAVRRYGAYFLYPGPMESLIRSSWTIMIIISISPAKPPGAFSTASCLRYQRAHESTRMTRSALPKIREATFLVMEISNGRISSPSGPISTILSSYRPSCAMKRPSYSCPCPIFEDMNTCHPVLLRTMHGSGISMCRPFHSVICHPYESPMCPKIISATSTFPSSSP